MIVDWDKRNEAFNNNFKEEVGTASFCELFIGALNDFTLKILMVASVISILISCLTADADEVGTAWIEGFAILVAVAVCSLVGATNDYKKE